MNWCTIAALAAWSLSATSPAQDWESFENLTLPEAPKNMDGDSIPMVIEGEEVTINLYFIDAAEDDNGDEEKVAEQAKDWNCSIDEVVIKGQEATNFAKAFLANGFTVETKKAKINSFGGGERWYGMIKVGNEYLSQALVRRELARIKGRTATLMDGSSATSFVANLGKIEGKGEADPAAASPASAGTAVEAATALPATISTKNPAIVYSDKGELKKVGTLPAGREVKVLGEERLIRVQIEVGEGKEPIVGLIRKNDL